MSVQSKNGRAVRMHPTGRREASKRHRHSAPSKLDDLNEADQEAIAEISKHWLSSEEQLWRVGDLVRSLTDRKRRPIPLRLISSCVDNRSKAALSKAQIAARTFADKTDRKRTTVTLAYEIALTLKQLPYLRTELHLTPTTALDIIVNRDASARSARHALVEWAHERRRDQRGAKEDETQRQFASPNPDRLICGRWEDQLDRIRAAQPRLVLADPVYPGYDWHSSGVYRSGREHTSGMLSGFACADEDEALRNFMALFELLPDVLSDDCLMLTWDAGGHPLFREILEAAHKGDWHHPAELIWLKDSCSPCCFEHAFTPFNEKAYLFSRSQKCQRDRSDGALGRSNILWCPSVTQRFNSDLAAGRKPIGGAHAMQKPIALLEYIILKLTEPGDTIVDLFGCSGSASIAAIKRQRETLYIEAFDENFAFGSERIDAALRRDWDAIADFPGGIKHPPMPPGVIDVIHALDELDKKQAQS